MERFRRICTPVLTCAIALGAATADARRSTVATQAPLAGVIAPGGAQDVRPLLADVLVLDADGRPVPGLVADDFVVAVDGAPRRVLTAQTVVRLRTASLGGLPAVAPRDRLVVVVVDEASIARGNEQNAVKAATRLLDRLSPSERLAIVRLPTTAGRLVLTTNGPAVAQVARAVIGHAPRPGLAVGSADTPSYNDDVDPAEERGNPRPPGATLRGAQSPADRVAEIEALSSQVLQASASTLPELRRLLATLKSLPGSKSIILLSVGVATDWATVRSIAAAAAAARATIHVIQLAPAAWQREAFASQPAEAPGEEQSAPAARLGGTVGLPALAGAAGGLFAPAARKVETQVDRFVTQIAASYVLEIEPRETDREERPHAMRIGLARPARLTVRSTSTWMPPPAPTAPAPDPATATATPVPIPRSATRRPASTASDPELLGMLERVGEWLTAYVQDLSSVVAEERYRQTTYRGTADDKRRVLRSDFLLLKAETGGGWTPFRDVFEVDGRAVRDREDRLKKLFLEKPDVALREALRIKEESVRYMLGDGNTKSNVNWPTLALEFLLPGNQWRFSMRRRGEETIEGIRAWRVDYTETAVPTMILTYDRLSVPARGTFWIEPATGRVLKTTLQTGSSRFLEMTITVAYRPSESLGLWVPSEMREQFASRLSVLLDGRATYSNFRRFQVSTAEQIKVPK